MDVSKDKREENESDLCMNSKWQKALLKKQRGREAGEAVTKQTEPFVPMK